MSEIFMFPIRFIDRMSDRIFSIAGALVFSQFPQFVAQYIQRLGGHVDELKSIIYRYQSAASENGKSLEAFIQAHLGSGVTDFVNSGKIMKSNIDRFSYLSDSLSALASSTGLDRPFAFIKYFDMEIFRATLKSFTPGITVTAEGVAYAATGLLFGALVYYIIKKIFITIFGKTLG